MLPGAVASARPQPPAQTALLPCSVRRMLTVGIVLSAGGMLGDPWHSGVLASVADNTGFDARAASLIVGTSAGSVTAVGLRAGISAHDRVALHRGEPLSNEGEQIVSRIHTPWSEPEESRSILPSSLGMAVHAIWPPWQVDPVRLAVGVLPQGRRNADSLSKRISEVHPGPWTDQPTWVVAVRSDDGRRVVFGRDDVKAVLGDAVQASCAVPGVYRSKQIGRHHYVDGGIHSSTNADVVASLGFDVVIVSSAMTATEQARNPISHPQRTWFSKKLDSEVDAIRRSGTPVLVVEPGRDEVPHLSKDVEEPRANAANLGSEAAERALASVDGVGIRAMLRG